MKVLSLFSGIGGFDLGFERAGMTVVGMCEIDKHAQKILTRHFPNAILHTDVKDVHYAAGTIDLICGGFPCQDLSVAGKRRGLAGDRSGLWHEFARIIDETRPAWVVIENVQGLFSANDGLDFAVIIDWLANRGYGVGWRMLDSQGFGLAQRRKRVFIVGSLGNPSACTVLLESDSLRRDYKTSRQASKNNSRAIAKCLNSNGQRNDASVETYVMREDAQAGNFNIYPTDVSLTLQSLQPAPTSHHAQMLVAMNDEPQTEMMSKPVAFKMRVTGLNANGSRGSKRTIPGGSGYLESPKAFTVATTHDQFIAVPHSMGINGQHPQWTPLHELSHALNVTKVEQVATMLWEAKGFDSCRISTDQNTTPTLSARMGTGGNNTPLVGVRRLTPIECERLQGFPDGWTDSQPDTQRYKQLGNAVSVPVAQWIGKRIMEKHNAKVD